MKKKLFILIAITLIFSSCSLYNANKIEDDIKVTVINQTNQFIKYSLIDSNTNYYINDFVGSPLKDILIAPAGTVREGTELDKMYSWLKPGKYNVKIVVYKDNTYSTESDKYINEAIFYITSDYIITIGSNGVIY